MNVYVVMENRRIEFGFGPRSVMFVYVLEEDAIKQVAQLEKDRDDELMRNIDGYYYEVMEVKGG